MRQSDELEEIFRKYWDRMSDRTRNLAQKTMNQAREADKSKENQKNIFIFSDSNNPSGGLIESMNS
jgi:hypothetical protein